MIRMIPVLPRHRVVLKKEQLGDTCMQPSEEKWRKTGEENWRNILFQRKNGEKRERKIGETSSFRGAMTKSFSQVERCFADNSNVQCASLFLAPSTNPIGPVL